MWDKFIFPKPCPSYSNRDFCDGKQKLLYIESTNKKYKIPCLMTQHARSKDYMLFFHGNGEDLGRISWIHECFQRELQMNIIGVEYPGYGKYKKFKTNAHQIEIDAQRVYDYLQSIVKQDQIYIFGRSIGSGPACYLAANNNPKMLILMAPLSSVRNAIKERIELKYFSENVPDIFKNFMLARKINCNVLIIHGLKDKLIPLEHSVQIFEKYEKQSQFQSLIFNDKLCKFELRIEMEHNNFLIDQDLINPIKIFIEKINIGRHQHKQQEK